MTSHRAVRANEWNGREKSNFRLLDTTAIIASGRVLWRETLAPARTLLGAAGEQEDFHSFFVPQNQEQLLALWLFHRPKKVTFGTRSSPEGTFWGAAERTA
jgi:hypothetical protein